MTRRGRRIQQLAVGGGLLVAVVLGVSLGAQKFSRDDPASPAVLNRIAAKNEDAALNAAARMKAESAASAEATDARLRATAAASESAAPEPSEPVR